MRVLSLVHVHLSRHGNKVRGLLFFFFFFSCISMCVLYIRCIQFLLFLFLFVLFSLDYQRNIWPGRQPRQPAKQR